MNAWLRQHAQALRDALGKLAAQRTASLLNALVIGVALALPVGGYVFLANLQSVSSRSTLEPEISVYLVPEAKPADAEALAVKLRADPRIASVRFVSREAALKALQRTEGFAELIEALDRNPLPDAFVLRVKDAAPAGLDTLSGELRRLAGIAHVQTDSLWAQRLAALIDIARAGMLLLTALLATGLLAVTFNSIRLQILTQREEIEVSRLLGATDGFIQRPFYYLGALQGLAGGAIALGFVAASVAVLNRGVRQLSATYGSAFDLAFVSPPDAAAVALFAMLLGWLGANLSVSMYLREIEPK
jgi:cell division transport system permease protein